MDFIFEFLTWLGEKENCILLQSVRRCFFKVGYLQLEFRRLEEGTSRSGSKRRGIWWSFGLLLCAFSFFRSWSQRAFTTQQLFPFLCYGVQSGNGVICWATFAIPESLQCCCTGTIKIIKQKLYNMIYVWCIVVRTECCTRSELENEERTYAVINRWAVKVLFWLFWFYGLCYLAR